MAVQIEEAEAEILDWLSKPNNSDTRIAILMHAVTGAAGYGVRWKSSKGDVKQALWSLISKRMLYLDMDQQSPENWPVYFTEKGRSAADRTKLTPDNVTAYLSQIDSTILGFSGTARLYLEESLTSFSAECFLASTMMVGVATEACFYDVAGAFANWLGGNAGHSLDGLLDQPTRAYIHKFTEFQKKLSASKGHLPPALQQNLDLNINSALELIRLARNEVGHPTNQSVDRDSAYQYLVLFPMLAKRMYGLKHFFENSHTPKT
ncbi:MAG: hypothetical protein JWR16_247 [Nevskia sp.]|nr:hypothetical protein [Nevskia sp.]